MNRVQKILSCVIFLSSSLHAAAYFNLDVYGVEPALEKKIIAACKDNIAKREAVALALRNDQSNEKLSDQGRALDNLVKKQISSLGEFSYINISTIYYMGKTGNYTTVDLVKKSDSFRIPDSSSRIIKKNMVIAQPVSNLFKRWDAYAIRNTKFMFSQKQGYRMPPCPVAHCVGEFRDAEAKKDLIAFKKGSRQYKKELMDIVKYNENDQLRANAIFLLAHNDNYQELADFLAPYISDESSTVRNNAMRVISPLIADHNVKGTHVLKIIKAMNYPETTDRNKASYVLLNLIKKNKALYPLVITESGDTLIKLLRLRQPDNHAFAYEILKTLSNKNYAETDYQSWQKWIDTQKAILA